MEKTNPQNQMNQWINKKTIQVEQSHHLERVDKFLASIEEGLTRSYIQKLIDQRRILVNQKYIKNSYKVCSGDMVSYDIPIPEEIAVEPEDIPLDIIYEDKDIIIINKPQGMPVHPSAGHQNHTLVNALLYHCRGSLSGINGRLRPGIVHRIDMNTTGILAACKNDAAHQCLSMQLKDHSITRKYNALVYGNFDKKEGRVEEPIGRHPVERKKMAVNWLHGKPAATNYKVLEEYGKQYTHMECILETGRTHQIRVHMAYIRHPLIGDAVYGRAKDEWNIGGQALHARVLGLVHPTLQKYIEFEAPLPKEYLQLIEKLRNSSR